MRLRPVGTHAASRLAGVAVVSAAAVLVACGSQLSDDEATAVAALGGGPTPSIEGASMFRGGPSRDGVYHVDGPPKTATQAWTFEAVGDAYSSPAVAKGVVYFGGIANGAEKWRFKTKGDVWPSPAVANGTVYFGSYDTHLYAVDAATGAERWRYKTSYRIRSSPAVIGRVVVFGSKDGNLVAVDAERGEERWRYRPDFDWATIWTSSPIIVRSKNLAYVGVNYWSGSSGGGQVLAVDLDSGQQVWQTRLPGDGFDSTLTITEDAIFVTGADGTVYALR